jgi:hypothetical protein
MKSRTEYLTFNLPARMAFENITDRVEEIVAKSGVQEGLVLVNAMHTRWPWSCVWPGNIGLIGAGAPPPPFRSLIGIGVGASVCQDSWHVPGSSRLPNRN